MSTGESTDKGKEEWLHSARLSNTVSMVMKYKDLYEKGELRSPLDVLHTVMYSADRDADIITAANSILKYTAHRPPVQKQIAVSEEAPEMSQDKRERLLVLLKQTGYTDSKEQTNG